MTDEARRRDQLIGVFVLGVVLFNPPLLDLFSGMTLFGLPLLYTYIFAVWTLVVVCIAIVVERRRRRHSRVDSEE
jgi:hypothetical protein